MIKISKAKKKDVLAIVELERETWEEFEVSNIYDVAVKVDLGYVFVAKDDNKLIGAIISFLSNKRFVYVEDIIIKKEYRGKGIGSKLYNKLINYVKMPIRGLVSEEYKESQKLHEKLGFKKIKTVKNPYGEEEKENYYLYEYNPNQ